jgi:hypothetical protein
VLGLAASVTTRRWITTNRLRIVWSQAPGPVSCDHRVLTPRRWSAWGWARAVSTFLYDRVAPPGSVLLAGDATVTKPRGPQGVGQGRYREGGRSSHRYTA